MVFGLSAHYFVGSAFCLCVSCCAAVLPCHPAACLKTEQELQRALTPTDLPAVQPYLRSSCSSSNGPHLAAADQLLTAWLHNPAEFAPVCAVLGGVIANNVVAAVSASSAPLNNLLYYSLFDSRAIVEQQPQAAAHGAAATAGVGGGAKGVDVAQPGEDALVID